MQPLLYAWRQTARLVSSHTLLWLPFLLAALVEAALIGILWLAPHDPFSSLLAPPVRFLAGDKVLHFPWHLWFLYYASTRYTYVMASVMAGAFFTGLACAMTRQTDEGAQPSLHLALTGGTVRYSRVTLLWLISWGLAKAALTALALAHQIPGLLWIGILLAWMLQAALLYAIPFSVFEQQGILRSLVSSLRETLRYPVSTLLITIVSTAPVVLWSLIAGTSAIERWIQAVPERVLPLMAGRMLLWAVADAVLTVSIAHLWWVHRQPSVPAAGAPERSSGPGISPRTLPTPALLVSVPLLLSMGLVLPGCSKSYQGERLFWKASQRSAAVLRDPEKADAEEFKRAIAAFQRVTDQTRGLIWGARAYLAIGSLQAAQHHYDEARKAYEQVVVYYDEFDELALTARLAIAKTYEAEQRFERAIDWYNQIVQFHPWSRIGLEAPLYVAQYYTQMGKVQRAQIAYEHAADIYRKRVEESPSQQMTNVANGYLAVTYQQLGDWKRAVEIMETLAQQQGVDRAAILMRLGALYDKLNRRDKSTEAYAALVKEFPEHPLSQEAKRHLGQPGAASAVAVPPPPGRVPVAP